MIGRYGIKGLVIDPYNKILHRTQNMYDPSYINEFMNRLTNFSVTWNIHTFLIAHPSKLLKDKGEVKLNIADILNRPAYFYHDLDNSKNYKSNNDAVAIKRNYGTTFSISFGYNIR